MVDTSKLKVSLTKHGAHKIAQLLVKYGASGALDHVVDDELAIDINLVQARKNLSADDGTVPSYWNEIVKLGQNAINAAVLVSIIFSHHELIKAMAVSCGEKQIGKLTGSIFTNRKGFTNFKNDICELGFSVLSNANGVVYDLSNVVSNVELSSYIRLIIEDKLRQAGWDGRGDSISLAVTLNFNEVFGLSEDAFTAWLSGRGAPVAPSANEDEFKSDSLVDFAFRSGHTPRTTVRSSFHKPQESPESQLMHNFLQTRLYEQLAVIYPKDRIGTEVPVGVGRACVDICLIADDQLTIFYEIKTHPSARACVREALGQALEYAYWPDTERAQKLVIVSPARVTESLITYMQLLRTRFGHKIYYQQVNERSGQLCGNEV